jgi:DnaJ-class molecular chaperone
MNENGLIFRDVTGFIPCPDCDGQDSTADAYSCDTCLGHGVLPLCGDTTITLPAELLSLIEGTAQS